MAEDQAWHASSCRSDRDVHSRSSKLTQASRETLQLFLKRTTKRHHDTAYAVFHSAAWEWDDLGIVLATLILTHLIPGGVVWIVVDDTLCHKRGAKVAFCGIFLDAVLSSKRHKTLRFGLNWVVLGIAVPIPFRTDRYYCLPVLWRLSRKKGLDGYQTRPQAAAALAWTLAEANPERTFWLVGDSAYVNAAVLQDRPKNLQVIGPGSDPFLSAHVALPVAVVSACFSRWFQRPAL